MAYELYEADTVEFNSTYAARTKILMMDDEYGVIAYTDSLGKPWVHAFTVASNGDLANSSSMRHTNIVAHNTDIIKIDSTHFAVSYESSDNELYIKTFSINLSNGNITALLETTIEDVDRASESSMILLDATHLAITYFASTDLTHYKSLVEIYSISGTYSCTYVSHYTLGTQLSMYIMHDMHLLQLQTSYLVVTYTEVSSSGVMKMLYYHPSTYQLSYKFIINLGNSYCAEASMLVLDGSHILLAHTGTSDTGFLKVIHANLVTKVFTITTNLQHNNTRTRHSSLTEYETDTFDIAFSDVNTKGQISRFTINASYAITEQSTTEFSSDSDESASVSQGDFLIVSYRGDGDDGWLISMDFNAQTKKSKINVNGAWKAVKDMRINVNGAWKQVTKVYVNVNGAWKLMK